MNKRKYPDLNRHSHPWSPSIVDVYCWMRPGQTVVTEYDDNGNIVGAHYEFEQEDPPTQEEIDYCTKVLLEHYEKNKHVFPRQMSYPPIGDQLDALYHAGVFPPEMAEKIKAVKDSFPKPDAASGNL